MMFLWLCLIWNKVSLSISSAFIRILVPFINLISWIMSRSSLSLVSHSSYNFRYFLRFLSNMVQPKKTPKVFASKIFVEFHRFILITLFWRRWHYKNSLKEFKILVSRLSFLLFLCFYLNKFSSQVLAIKNFLDAFKMKLW